MSWYFTKLVYRFICGTGKHTPQFNEQVRIIEAEDSLHAFYKARQIGERETTNFSGIGVNLCWKFIDVIEILPVLSVTDGAEVFSALYENEDAESYIRVTRKKAAALLQEGIFEFNSINTAPLATHTGY